MRLIRRYTSSWTESNNGSRINSRVHDPRTNKGVSRENKTLEIAANEKNTHCAVVSHRTWRNVASHSRGVREDRGVSLLRSYPSISPNRLLNPVLLDLAAPAFPRPKPFRRARKRGREGGRGRARKKEKAAVMKEGEGGERERKREIEFLGCILKPVELSGTSGGKVQDGNPVFRIFSFVCPLFRPAFLSLLSIFLYI